LFIIIEKTPATAGNLRILWLSKVHVLLTVMSQTDTDTCFQRLSLTHLNL